MSHVNGAGGGVARKLVVGVEFQANAQQANRAMEDLARQADRVAAGMGKAQQETAKLFRSPTVLGQQHVMGPPGGGPGGPAAQPAGFTGDLKFAADLAAAAAAATAVAGVAESLVRLGRSAKTAREDMESGILSWIPGFNMANRAVYGAVDELTSGAELDYLQRRRDRGPVDDAAAAGERARRRFERESGFEAAARREELRLAVEGRTPAGAVAVLGGIGAGGLESDHPAVRAAREQRERAEREAGVARFELNERAREVVLARGDAASRADALGRAHREADRTFEAAKRDDFAQPQFEAARAKLAEQVGMATASLARQEEAIAGYREKALAAAKKDYDLARLKTGELKAQAQSLAEQEAKSRGMAVQFGAMMPHEQDILLQAARDAKEFGIANVTPEQKQLLLGNAVTSGWAAQEFERFANADPRFQEFMKEFNKRLSDDLARERVKVEADVKFQVEFNEKNVRETYIQVMREVHDELRDLMVKQAQIQKAEVRAQQLQAVGGAQ